RSQWQGKADNGRDIYENANMYWSGSIYGLIQVPAEKSVLKIKARGEPVKEAYPFMLVELDNQLVAETVVDSREFKEYQFLIQAEPGIKALKITFLNDETDKRRGEDRNLYVREAEITKQDD
ncbi:MAG: carbohydrate-binding domain-containing protein, partial [Candidatus Omnitrophota bacterium]